MKVILDTNTIVRFIRDDNAEQTEITENILATQKVVFLAEVIAECAHILFKYYEYSRVDIANALVSFVEDNDCDNIHIINALKLYGNSNFDFVDCILFTYSSEYNIHTFDKKLNALIKRGGQSET